MVGNGSFPTSQVWQGPPKCRCTIVLLLFLLLPLLLLSSRPSSSSSSSSFFSSSSLAFRSCCFKNRSCGNLAQSQVLNVYYLRLQQESELSSPEPLNSSRLSLCWAASDMASALLGLPNRALHPRNHILQRPKMEDSPVKRCGCPTLVGKT